MAMISVTITNLRAEHQARAFGIDCVAPRLSWVIAQAPAGWQQAGYEIARCAADGTVLESAVRQSSDSVLVAWPFAELSARQQIFVRVRVWGIDQHHSEWSDLLPIEIGLLSPADWSAQFISPDWDEDTSTPQPAPLLRKPFQLCGVVVQARLYISALGIYEAQINGQLVSDELFAPGWTSYHHRLRYQTYDVTALLQPGENVIGAMLGDGWFRGRFGFGGGRRNIYGDRLALLAQLEVTYQDGSSERIVSDTSWQAATGPILASDIYDGEIYDARRERTGWAIPGYLATDWVAVRAIDYSFATLCAPLGPPVRRIETLPPQSISTSPTGRTIIDFGQNLVGRIRFTVQGSAGQTITLRHAEVLEGGELSIRPLRFAAATDHYTMRGGDPETWEPRFTFHGFRYAEVSGWPGELQPGDLCAVVCHSDLERTGWFECSDPLINRLHENVLWSMRGNFFDIPTDCPQRDERLGWTGDIQVFSPTASFLYHSAGFLQSWLADLAAEQRALGTVPFVVPTVMERPNPPAAAWGDAATFVPWVLYQRYGDTGILAQQFESMCAWVDQVAAQAGPTRLWDRGFQFGDWLDPIAPPDNPAAARTSPQVVATAYFARSAEILSMAAEVLGHTAEAEHYRALAEEVREAFCAEYVTANGRVIGDSATAYSLAIEFALLRNPSQRQHAGKRLAVLMRQGGYRISTGFVGTPLVCDALSSVGEYEAAFRLISEQRCPSWLYPVTMGATTIWERWDSMLPDGSVNPGEMTSFNHYALGAVADWLHRVVAGLAPAAPGYRQIVIAPHLGAGLTYARARHHSPYGPIEAGWQIEGATLTIHASIPHGTTATVHLPGATEPFIIGPGQYQWQQPCQPPPPAKPLTLDSTMAEVVDRQAQFNAIIAYLHEKNYITAGILVERMAGRDDITLRQALALLPTAGLVGGELEALLAKN
ncbi:MAG: glycoside hydrolase family 78 protein [Roseiflexaceae bacterium]